MPPFDLPNDSDVARPCRPTVSCTADFAPPGALEAEFGAFYSRLGGGDRLWNYPFLLKQTLGELVQLQVGSNGYTVVRSGTNFTSTRHVDNIVFGPKLHLVNQGTVAPSLALSALVSISAFAAGSDAELFTFYGSKDVGPLHADLNLGAALWERGGAAKGQPFTALALSTSPVPPFGFALEGYAFGDALPYAPRDGGIRGAIAMTARSWLVFDFGGDVGWFPSTRAFSLFLGMTIVPVVFRSSPS